MCVLILFVSDDKGEEGEGSPVEEGPQEMTLEEYRAKNNPVCTSDVIVQNAGFGAWGNGF